ncbi:integrase core domain-containing protein [Pectobacterium versatile]|uniref:integrase core domain-containing protein n=1 Tax=Pectobacterium versatile TaxID=2488639 RepID=UPI00338EBC40
MQTDNRSFRDEFLDVRQFTYLEYVQEKTENWRQEYNQQRHYSSLNNQTLEVFSKSKKNSRSPISPSANIGKRSQ